MIKRIINGLMLGGLGPGGRPASRGRERRGGSGTGSAQQAEFCYIVSILDEGDHTSPRTYQPANGSILLRGGERRK